MSGTPDWGGSALASGHTLLINESAQTLAQGASVPISMSISRPGYIVRINLANKTSAAVLLPVRFLVQWQDSSTGEILDDQAWTAWAGSLAEPHSIAGSGPTDGDTLIITITNLAAAAETLQFDIYVAQVTSTYGRHDWHTDDNVIFNIAGLTEVISDMNAGIIGVVNALALAIGVGGQATRAMPLYAGAALLWMSTSGSNADLEWWIYPQSDGDIPTTAPLLNGATTANGTVIVPINLPRAQCLLVLQNNDSATKTVSVGITAASI